MRWDTRDPREGDQAGINGCKDVNARPWAGHETQSILVGGRAWLRLVLHHPPFAGAGIAAQRRQCRATDRVERRLGAGALKFLVDAADFLDQPMHDRGGAKRASGVLDERRYDQGGHHNLLLGHLSPRQSHKSITRPQRARLKRRDHVLGKFGAASRQGCRTPGRVRPNKLRSAATSGISTLSP